MGGDEFTVTLDEISRVEHAAQVAQRIMDVLAPPYDLGAATFAVTVSIGISLYPDDGVDIETLLEKADRAMYQAKKRGRNGYVFYSNERDDAEAEN